ncbi:MAG: type II secretion system protein [Lentisphaeria bacterium]|nr:type II secretion system protein [Lentisphaeria bacterium]
MELLACQPELNERRQVRSRFTLIELLVVIAIIGILASLLLPALGRARDKALDIKCLANQRSCALAILTYAEDNNGWMPYSDSIGLFPDTYYSISPKRDLIPLLAPYIQSFAVWQCTRIGEAALINDPANDASIQRRGTYSYWGYLSGIGGTVLPGRLEQQSSMNAVVSDVAYTWSGNWRTTHDAGPGSLRTPYSDMPSFQLYFNGFPAGVNQVYADGHGAWSDGDELKYLYSNGSMPCYGAGDTVLSGP